MQTLNRCPFSDGVQVVNGEPKGLQGCMCTPHTHSLPIQTLTLETLKLCSVFFISVHLADLLEQKLDQECRYATLSWRLAWERANIYGGYVLRLGAPRVAVSLCAKRA